MPSARSVAVHRLEIAPVRPVAREAAPSAGALSAGSSFPAALQAAVVPPTDAEERLKAPGNLLADIGDKTSPPAGDPSADNQESVPVGTSTGAKAETRRDVGDGKSGEAKDAVAAMGGGVSIAGTGAVKSNGPASPALGQKPVQPQNLGIWLIAELAASQAVPSGAGGQPASRSLDVPTATDGASGAVALGHITQAPLAAGVSELVSGSRVFRPQRAGSATSATGPGEGLGAPNDSGPSLAGPLAGEPVTDVPGPLRATEGDGGAIGPGRTAVYRGGSADSPAGRGLPVPVGATAAGVLGGGSFDAKSMPDAQVPQSATQESGHAASVRWNSGSPPAMQANGIVAETMPSQPIGMAALDAETESSRNRLQGGAEPAGSLDAAAGSFGSERAQPATFAGPASDVKTPQSKAEGNVGAAPVGQKASAPSAAGSNPVSAQTRAAAPAAADLGGGASLIARPGQRSENLQDGPAPAAPVNRQTTAGVTAGNKAISVSPPIIATPRAGGGLLPAAPQSMEAGTAPASQSKPGDGAPAVSSEGPALVRRDNIDNRVATQASTAVAPATPASAGSTAAPVTRAGQSERRQSGPSGVLAAPRSDANESFGAVAVAPTAAAAPVDIVSRISAAMIATLHGATDATAPPTDADGNDLAAPSGDGAMAAGLPNGKPALGAAPTPRRETAGSASAVLPGVAVPVPSNSGTKPFAVVTSNAAVPVAPAQAGNSTFSGGGAGQTGGGLQAPLAAVSVGVATAAGFSSAAVGQPTAAAPMVNAASHLSALLIGSLHGDQDVRLRLRPSGLGDVDVRVVVSGQDVAAWFDAAQTQAQQALGLGMGQLHTDLAAAGYNLTGAWVGGEAWTPHGSPGEAAPPAPSAPPASAPAENPRTFASPVAASGLSIYV